MQTGKNLQADLQIRKNNRGVTLLEVIAVIAVLGVVLASVTAFLLTGVKMSAQVSDGAKFSIREVTAVEFINKALYKSTKIAGLPATDENGATPEIYTQLELTSSGTTATLYSEEGTVYYEGPSGSRTALCSGEIYFKMNGDTVTYVLNGTEHIVHLRMKTEQ